MARGWELGGGQSCSPQAPGVTVALSMLENMGRTVSRSWEALLAAHARWQQEVPATNVPVAGPPSEAIHTEV